MLLVVVADRGGLEVMSFTVVRTAKRPSLSGACSCRETSQSPCRCDRLGRWQCVRLLSERSTTTSWVARS
eukprot:4140304-Prymnesium_polylepis.1